MSAEAAHSGVSPAGSDRVTVATDELRSLVVEWTLSMKREGLPPEKVLVAVKAFVKNARPRHWAPNDIEAQLRHDALLADASQWCIAAYFDETGSRRAD